MKLRTIRAIMRRELIDVLRDRRSLFLTLLYPITMLLMYGYGIADVDSDRSPCSTTVGRRPAILIGT
jgi:hypothetical protein